LAHEEQDRRAQGSREDVPAFPVSDCRNDASCAGKRFLENARRIGDEVACTWNPVPGVDPILTGAYIQSSPIIVIPDPSMRALTFSRQTPYSSGVHDMPRRGHQCRLSNVQVIGPLALHDVSDGWAAHKESRAQADQGNRADGAHRHYQVLPTVMAGDPDHEPSGNRHGTDSRQRTSRRIPVEGMSYGWYSVSKSGEKTQ
jgi:hypothetical protein